MLAEMFPTVSHSELVHCLSLAAGNLDVAAQHLLENMDSANEHCSSPLELVFIFYQAVVDLDYY